MKLQLRLFLEGRFEIDDMRNDLNVNGLLLVTQPYYTFPWKYYGMESIAGVPSGDDVDLVLVDLINIESLYPLSYTIINRRVVLLLQDGTISDPEGNSTL